MSDGPNSPEFIGKDVKRLADQIEVLLKALPASEPRDHARGRLEDLVHYTEEATKAPAVVIPHHPTGVCACPDCWPKSQGC